MPERTLVGQRVARIDSLDKATGQARYTADLTLPRMLYAKVLRSPHPHARILNIDTGRAERLAGVKAVVTGKDTAGAKWGVFRYTRDQQLLTEEKVRYIGEDVAAVSAEDEETAMEALELIEVDYEVLPAVFDPVEAMQAGAPQIHDHAEDNINIHVPIEVGDVDRAFKEAYYIREDRFVDSEYTYCQTEPYAVLANCDLAGDLEIWTPNASPHTKAKALSNLLEMPLSKVRVRKVCTGGAFGGRSDIFPGEFIAALLARKAGRPVKLVYTREESFTSVRQAHCMIVDLKTGVAKDGTFLANEIKVVMDGGAYSSTGPIATSVPFLVWEETYRLPNVRFNGYRVYTNKPVRGMYRCHGRAFLGGLGMQLDMIAEELGIDPVEIRLKNALKTGDMQATGSKIISCGLSEAIENAAEKSGWREKRGKLPYGKGIGIGANGMMVGFPMGIRGGSSAMIKFNEDGGATLISGVVDNGQGNDSMVVQVAADVLGLKMDDISLVSADSEITPLDQGAYSQAATFVSANAVKAAAMDAREQILSIASDMLDATADELDLKDGYVLVKERPDWNVWLGKVIRKALIDNTPVMGRGSYMPKVDQRREWVSNPQGQHAGTFSFGAVVAEVEADPETGQVRVTDVTGAHDCGFAINPTAVEGQLEGSAASGGVGATLLEEHYWDQGQMLNANMLEYKVPLAVDMPNITPIIVETLDPEGPFGAKEAGLWGSMNMFQAIGSAVYDAVGVWIKDFPITPDKVLTALEEKDRES
ncbi:MAG: molybdopterin-dependent oxidoreductase [Anaerolineae bacterium]|nr:molybdopterin-dependent oxidoreductase [Anaerolineae bacterium]NIN95443.1 molybdopterin-dependent oxidoreductase [Anaerolineae bacterium]NIQ78418.1 molybdopterin-dependent oxidoreductase [Anaerolineae bacterium]